MKSSVNEKYLEFIQSNIARMNQNSIQMKAFCIAIVSSILAIFAATLNNGDGNVYFLYVAIVPTMLFWKLDSFSLQQERKFRGLYNDILSCNCDDINEFSISLQKYNNGKFSFWSSFLSKTELWFYMLLIIILVCTIFIAK